MVSATGATRCLRGVGVFQAIAADTRQACGYEDDQVTNRIKAWVVVQNGLDEASIVAYVADRLPRYMIPETFTFSDQLPKTSTGKINRQQLGATAN